MKLSTRRRIPRISRPQTKLALKVLAHAHRHISAGHGKYAADVMVAMHIISGKERDIVLEAVESGYYKRTILAYHSCQRSNCDWIKP